MADYAVQLIKANYNLLGNIAEELLKPLYDIMCFYEMYLQYVMRKGLTKNDIFIIILLCTYSPQCMNITLHSYFYNYSYLISNHTNHKRLTILREFIIGDTEMLHANIDALEPHITELFAEFLK